MSGVLGRYVTFLAIIRTESTDGEKSHQWTRLDGPRVAVCQNSTGRQYAEPRRDAGGLLRWQRQPGYGFKRKKSGDVEDG